MCFSTLGETEQRYENKTFCKNQLVYILGDSKTYPGALHKFPTQTVDLPQVFERWIFQTQPKIVNEMTKNCEKKVIPSFGTSFSLTGPWDLSLIDVVEDNFFENFTVLLVNHLAYRLIYSTRNFGKKIESNWKVWWRWHWQYNSSYKNYNFKCCIVHWPSNFAMRCEQWSVVLCRNG